MNGLNTNASSSVVNNESLKEESISLMVSCYDSARWSTMKDIAQVLYASKALNNNSMTIPDIMVLLQTGFEMGLTPMQSMHDLYIVKGRVCTFAEGTIKRVRAHNWWIEYIEESDTHVKAKFSKGDITFTEEYSFQDAVDSGYTAKGVGWSKGAKRKLKLRYCVVQKAIKTRIPEVMGMNGDIVELKLDETTVATAEELKVEKKENKKHDEEQEKKLDKGEVKEIELANGDKVL